MTDATPSLPQAAAESAATRDPFRRPVRETADGEARIRPLDLPGEGVEETDALRYPLLVLALLSVALVISLAFLRHEAVTTSGLPPLTGLERSHLPELLDIPAGRLEQTEPPARFEIAPFRISRTEVTVEQFRIFVLHTGYKNPAWADFPCLGSSQDLSWNQPGYEQAETYPAVCVSARDALAFTAWLSKETGIAMRLPTELEWEYAARAGSKTRFWWGDEYDAQYADCVGCDTRAPQHPAYVGSRPANDFGLLDVAGNVREWTCSPFAAPGTGTPGQCAATFDEATNLVVRGGSWQEPQQALQLSNRGPFGAWHRNVWTGFRVAASAGR
ncbi:MAG: Formylglycine-rating enzyme required for sulfatase, contains domain [Hydrocarboniphaga sp.]|uniref:formylglycine-generating enzyme family protein n=1 Tax=Hydrocarboniphaga sp. TaxID=2033016 RepID=UPI0026334D6F|nr:SUMF1/EgtB/PvdO family nonheme iron enzyme [Hydrocarboniphaga sp.]MDB5969164.1 Formylglycine-rating enzyme required for sulfatase, contains domain [Hydrocarboniphaga sp.]